VDLNALKARVAEALVESILRQAGYTVSRLGRECQVQRLVKLGGHEFAPDFLVWKPAVSSAARDLHQLLTVEVKYESQRNDGQQGRRVNRAPVRFTQGRRRLRNNESRNTTAEKKDGRAAGLLYRRRPGAPCVRVPTRKTKRNAGTLGLLPAFPAIEVVPPASFSSCKCRPRLVLQQPAR
jgi:hypothetical protein